MVLRDIFGKKVNAESFRLEVKRGYVGHKYDDPSLVLQGEYSYFVKPEFAGASSYYSYSYNILEILPATQDNIILLLDKADKLRKEQREIDDKLKLLFLEFEDKNGMCCLEDEQMVKFEKGYAFPMSNEDLGEKYINISKKNEIKSR